MGQGLKTVLAQIAADQIGVRPEDITVISGDTSTIQLGLGGFASRQTVTAGNSVHLAARAVREKAIAAAALMLDVPEENLDIRDGIVIEIDKIFQSRCATSPIHLPALPATRCQWDWRRALNPR